MVALIESHYSKPSNGRNPKLPETMLRIHLPQHWFAHSDPAVKTAPHDIRMLRIFACLDAVVDAIPNETTSLKFRHLLEWYGLAAAMLDQINNRY